MALNSDFNLQGLSLGKTSTNSGIGKAGAGLIASTVISGISDLATSLVNAQRTKNTYKFNAEMAKLQGRMNKLSANIEIRNIRKKANSLLSSQRAGYARAGMDTREGTPIAVMTKGQEEAELDVIYAEISRDYNVSLTNTQAGIYEMQGKSAVNDSITNSVSTILNTGSKAYSQYQLSKLYEGK
jgi:hypothetical protein